MAENEKEEIPMLSCRLSDGHDADLESQSRPTSRTRSASMSIPIYSTDYLYETETRHVSHTGPLRSERRTQTHHVSHTGPLQSESRTQTHHVSHTGPLQSERRTPLVQMSCPIYTNKPCPIVALKGRTSEILKTEEFPALPSISATDKKTWLDDNPAGKNEHLLRSGQLGRCNDPYCTTCPTYYYKPALTNKSSSSFESKFHNILSGDAEGWMRRSFSCLGSCVPGIMNPHAKFVQQWNKFFVISCLVSIFIDPLFFFLLSVEKENKCIVLHWPMAITIAVVRSITDFIYLLHMLLQFRLAYIAPESRVVGAGELVDQPKKIALHYLHGSFCIDVFVVLPLPQFVILFIFPTYFGSSPTNYEKNLLMATVLLQYFPRFYRFLPLLSGSSANGFIFETTSANFVLNFFICALAGHVVGSCWYLFGLQRINHCLRQACVISKLKDCKRFIDCGGQYQKEPVWKIWKNHPNSTNCLGTEGPFSYGIYQQAVELTTIPSIVIRYMYSFFWGFQQVSTLAGNQVPSYYIWEIIFSVCIGALGLFFLALLVGNMMNFLQALGRRKSEMQLRRHDVEQWMSHRRLPPELRRQVRQSERFYWAATRGVNEEVLLENMPEDLQREIRRHLFTFIKKVRILSLMEDPVLDAICERLRQKLYIKESKVFYYGGVVDKIIFIVRGNMMSVDADGNQAPLTEGDICGEELLTWCLDHSSVKDGRKIHASGHRFLSNRTVTCLTNVEAFSLRATDLEEVTSLFPRFLRRPRIQGAIRYESPYWRGLAATRIQVAWKYRKKCLSRAETSKSGSTSAAR